MTTTTSKPVAVQEKTDLEELKEHVAAVATDLAALKKATVKILAKEAQRQVVRVDGLKRKAAETASDYGDVVSEKVKQRPLAAIGAAAFVGFVLASLSRR